jgi:hypothetical protein
MENYGRLCFLYMSTGDEFTLEQVRPRIEKNLLMLLPTGSKFVGTTWMRPLCCFAAAIVRFPTEEAWQDWVLSGFWKTEDKRRDVHKLRADEAEELWLTKSTALFEPVTRMDLSATPGWVLAHGKNSFNVVKGWAIAHVKYAAPVETPGKVLDNEKEWRKFLTDKHRRIISLGCNKSCGGGVFGDFEALSALQSVSRSGVEAPLRRSERTRMKPNRWRGVEFKRKS